MWILKSVYEISKVIGNMAAAIGAARTALKSAIIQCVNQPAASPEVQQAAIQAFRLTSVSDEVKKIYYLTERLLEF